jgi:hypothetical protein
MIKLLDLICKKFNSNSTGKDSNIVKELYNHPSADYILFLGSYYDSTNIYFEYAKYDEETDLLGLYIGDSKIGVTPAESISEREFNMITKKDM